MKTRWSRSFSLGAVAFIFLVIGYQSALFVHKAAVARIVADSVAEKTDGEGGVMPSNVGEVGGGGAGGADGGGRGGGADGFSGAGAFGGGGGGGRGGGGRADAGGGGGADGGCDVEKKEEIRKEIVRNFRPREEFRFNPNTVTAIELERLGFSEKQAASIVAYREKGGRFNRPSDFARSYVVSDEMFARLEKWIDIPLVNINSADSAAFDALPGIGPAFARRMVAYRESLGGLYSSPDQLLEIYNFAPERYDKIRDLITVAYPGSAGAPSTAPLLDPLPVLRLWSAPEDSLRRHPYIGSWKTAHAIQLYKASAPRTDWSLDGLVRAGIITSDAASKLSRYYRLE